jgi:hypothetical protein
MWRDRTPGRTSSQAAAALIQRPQQVAHSAAASSQTAHPAVLQGAPGATPQIWLDGRFGRVRLQASWGAPRPDASAAATIS